MKNRQEAKQRLIYNTTEDILVIMEQKGVSKKGLARKISKSKSHVTQMLSGSRNMTIGTLSDICVALGVDLKIEFVQRQHNQKGEGMEGKEFDEIDKMQYTNLRKNFDKLAQDVLGEGYYNMAMDVYEADRITCEDIARKAKMTWIERLMDK